MDYQYNKLESNKLHYTITFNDTNLEYIKADFDIPNFIPINYALWFTGLKLGNGFGFVGITYADLTTLQYTLKPYLSTQAMLLYTEFEVENITITISDNDGFNSGSQTGYISELGFSIGVGDLGLYTDTDLVDIIIFLIVLIAPTLIVYEGTKNRKFIMPMLVLMTIISLIGDLIPAWLFFVLLFNFGAIMYFVKEDN